MITNTFKPETPQTGNPANPKTCNLQPLNLKQKVISAAVAIIFRDNKILLGRRPAASRYGGAWEFPGGKLESDETPQQAVIREVQEELGITVIAPKFFHHSTSTFDDGGVFEVTYFLVNDFSGEPQSNAFEKIEWVEVREISRYEMLEGNREVVRMIESW